MDKAQWSDLKRQIRDRDNVIFASDTGEITETVDSNRRFDFEIYKSGRCWQLVAKDGYSYHKLRTSHRLDDFADMMLTNKKSKGRTH